MTPRNNINGSVNEVDHATGTREKIWAQCSTPLFVNVFDNLFIKYDRANIYTYIFIFLFIVLVVMLNILSPLDASSSTNMRHVGKGVNTQLSREEDRKCLPLINRKNDEAG